MLVYLYLLHVFFLFFPSFLSLGAGWFGPCGSAPLSINLSLGLGVSVRSDSGSSPLDSPPTQRTGILFGFLPPFAAPHLDDGTPSICLYCLCPGPALASSMGVVEFLMRQPSLSLSLSLSHSLFSVRDRVELQWTEKQLYRLNTLTTPYYVRISYGRYFTSLCTTGLYLFIKNHTKKSLFNTRQKGQRLKHPLGLMCARV